jgi:hypothetical protein
MPSIELIHAIAATSELCGTALSEPAAKMLLADLASFDEGLVLVALSKCRRELKGRLTLAEIIARIEDGRPGAEEAWAMLPRSEESSVVWTDEMAEAWGLVRSMIEDGETVAARMAFKEAYQRLIAEGRNSGRPVRWFASLGSDKEGRETVVKQAVEQGRLTAEHSKTLIPAPTEVGPMERFLLTGNSKPLLEAQCPENRAEAEKHIEQMKAIVGRFNTGRTVEGVEK